MVRFTFLVLTALSICVSVYAQNVTDIKVSLNKTQVSLEEILDLIEQQTQIGYNITSNLSKLSQPVTIRVKNVILDSALSIIFCNQPLYYRFGNNTITVTEKKTKPSLGNTVTGL